MYWLVLQYVMGYSALCRVWWRLCLYSIGSSTELSNGKLLYPIHCILFYMTWIVSHPYGVLHTFLSWVVSQSSNIYCRPSLLSIPSHLASIFYFIPPSVKKAAVCGIESKSKNPAWNSARTDKNGADLEYCFINQALSISNVDTSILPLKPSNASFVDVTLAVTSSHLVDGTFLSTRPYPITRLFPST